LHSHALEGAPGFEAGASAVSPLELGTGPENRTRRIRLVRAVSSPDEPVPCDRRYGDQDSNLNLTASKAGVLPLDDPRVVSWSARQESHLEDLRIRQAWATSPRADGAKVKRSVRGSGFAPESHGFRGRCPAVGPSPRSCRSHRRELHPLQPAYHAGIPLPGSRRRTRTRQWNWRESHPHAAACKAAPRTSRTVPFVNWWKLEGVAPSSGCLQGNGPHLVVSPVVFVVVV
jgi:hypothetical protein